MKISFLLKKERIQAFQSLTAKDNQKFGYLTTETCRKIFSDHKNFPNGLFLDIIKKIDIYGLEYYRECLIDDQQWNKKFRLLEQVYQQCQIQIYEGYLQQYNLQQQIQRQYQQQQYYLTQQVYLNPQNQQQKGYHRRYNNNYQERLQRQNENYSLNNKAHHKVQRNSRYHNQNNEYQGNQGSHQLDNSQISYGQTRHQKSQNHSIHQNKNQYLNSTQQNILDPKVSQKVEEIVKIIDLPKPSAKPMRFSLKQIRQFINQFSFDSKENVNEQQIKKINEVQSWKKGQQSFKQKTDRFQQDNKLPKKSASSNNQGTSSKTNTTAAPSFPKKTNLFFFGIHQPRGTQQIRNQIKKNAGNDFATLMQKQHLTLDNIQKAEKQIKYNLNLLAPENIKQISKDLSLYLFENKDICELLITQIIEKSWSQPKYVSTYAKLCSEFSKYPSNFFKFEKRHKRDNPFKVSLISTVQHSFINETQQQPQFINNDQKDNWLKQTKKKILGNVKFIAELIKQKIISRRIIKLCISQLILNFLTKYYHYRKEQKFMNSYYDYYFEAIIEFVENLGQLYEKIDQAKSQEEKNFSTYGSAQKMLIALIEMTRVPLQQCMQEIMFLKAKDYFRLFQIIDARVLHLTNPRLSALLLNLKERCSNGWQKHHSETDGPKKLKDLKESLAYQEQIHRVNHKVKQQCLHEQVQILFKDSKKQPNNQSSNLKTLLKKYSQNQLYTEVLKQVADGKKQDISKRVQLVNAIIDENLKIFKEVWTKVVKDMTFECGDYPFIGAALALVMKNVIEKVGRKKLKEYFLKFHDEDQQMFMEEIYGKLYHYTKFEEIKELTQPNKKYSNMLDI